MQNFVQICFCSTYAIIGINLLNPHLFSQTITLPAAKVHLQLHLHRSCEANRLCKFSKPAAESRDFSFFSFFLFVFLFLTFSSRAWLYRFLGINYCRRTREGRERNRIHTVGVGGIQIAKIQSLWGRFICNPQVAAGENFPSFCTCHFPLESTSYNFLNVIYE